MMEKFQINEKVLPIGFLLDERFIIKGYKNSGTNSIIYIAKDLYKKKDVIVKECYKEGAYNGRDLLTGLLSPCEEQKAYLSKKIELFIREAEKLQNLDNHTIIPQMYWFGKRNEYNAYIAMELLESQSIYELKILTVNQMLKYFEPLINVIRKMHKKGIIDGDLNIHNLLLVNRKIRLIDLGVAQKVTNNINNSILNQERKETHMLITKIIQQKRKEHPIFQIDIQALAEIMLDIYNYNYNHLIIKSKGMKKILENISEWKMSPEYTIEDMYEELYLNKKKTKIILSATSIAAVVIISCSIYVNSKTNELTNLGKIQNDDLNNLDPNKENLIKKIESECGYKLEDCYIAYEDFDSNGTKEMFAFVPTEIDQSEEFPDDWVNYGEIWFSDTQQTIKVDEIGMDDWQGGGFYAVNTLQFGSVIHVQLSKYYEYSIDAGPMHIYAYEAGMPVKTFEGYVKNYPFVDGGANTGVYYSSMALKGTTQQSLRTWDKIYVYYQNGEYISYKSTILEFNDLFEYDNFDNIIIEGLEDIFAGESEKGNMRFNIIPTTKYISGKEVYVYQCISESDIPYVTLYNCYLNESGRVYLNLTVWPSEEAYLNSSIWNEDGWHEIYREPVELHMDVDDDKMGYNYYITFKINRTGLDIEEVCQGYWEGNEFY